MTKTTVDPICPGFQLSFIRKVFFSYHTCFKNCFLYVKIDKDLSMVRQENIFTFRGKILSRSYHGVPKNFCLSRSWQNVLSFTRVLKGVSSASLWPGVSFFVSLGNQITITCMEQISGVAHLSNLFIGVTNKRGAPRTF